jgi:hypothetical protein
MKDLCKSRNRLMNADSGEDAFVKGQHKHHYSADMRFHAAENMKKRDHHQENVNAGN